MKSLYDPDALEEAKLRIAALTPAHQRVWGKMNASQMLAHCSAAMQMAMGDLPCKRVWIGKLIGPLFKGIYSNDKHWGKGTPTAPELVITAEHDLAQEQARLTVLITRFHEGGPTACTQHPHPFFGHLTPREWGIGMYKHLDHHLRQFNA
jgi:hypothetical protein